MTLKSSGKSLKSVLHHVSTWQTVSKHFGISNSIPWCDKYQYLATIWHLVRFVCIRYTLSGRVGNLLILHLIILQEVFLKTYIYIYKEREIIISGHACMHIYAVCRWYMSLRIAFALFFCQVLKIFANKWRVWKNGLKIFLTRHLSKILKTFNKIRQQYCYTQAI